MTRPARSPASSMPTRTASSSGRRRASSASPATRSRRPRLLLNLGLVEVPARARQFLRPGRQELHAAHDRLGLRRLRQAGAHVSRHHHGRHRQRRGGARSQARLRRRLRDGDAVARPAVHGGVPRSRRLGPRVHVGARRLREHGRHVDRRRGHAAGDEPRHAASRPRRTSAACRCRTCISTIIRTTSPCATTPTSRAARSTRRSARRGPSRRRPIPRPTISAPAG